MTTKFLGGAALALALLAATPTAAQNTGSMTSTALLLKPLTLTHLDDLDFGSIVPSGSGDFVTISAADGSRASPSATLITTAPGGRARFASSGIDNTFVFLELSQPPYADLENLNGDKLKLNSLALDGSALRVLTPAAQVFFVGIGGEIFVRPDQEDGDYIGTYTITATYL